MFDEYSPHLNVQGVTVFKITRKYFKRVLLTVKISAVVILEFGCISSAVTIETGG